MQRGLVREGTKLLTQGAELEGGEEGCHPLQPGARSLRLAVNSTRRVRWGARLGQASPLSVSLDSLVTGGGPAPLLRVRVARRYPLLYCVKEQDGKSSFLQERQWEVRRARSGEDSSLQSLYCQVEQEVLGEEERERGKGARVRESELEGLTDGAELWSLLEGCGDPSLASCLSEEQREAMEEAARACREERRRRVEEEVQRRLQEAGRGRSGQATPLLRVRLVDAREPEKEGARSALLTVWRPGACTEELREGALLGVTGCSVTRVDGHTVQLTAGRSSQYLELGGELGAGGVGRSLTGLKTVCGHGFRPAFNEVDVVAVVIR